MNKKIWPVVGAIIAVVAIIALVFVGQYNSLVSKQVEVERLQSNLETTLQRRNDLIPNLVNSVQGSMDQEKDVFKAIADARTKINSTQSGTAESLEAQQEMSSAVSRLLVSVENYPELKSNENVKQLMVELEGTENRISVARKDYNAAATEYNAKIRRFPGSIFAGMFGFEKVELFKATEQAKTTVPSVSFNKKD